MELSEIERLAAPFRAIGAHVAVRARDDGTHMVYGIQCRDRAAGDEHVALLSSFPDLHAVGFEGTQITDQGLVHLPSLSCLESLDLDRTQITDVGLHSLAAMTWLEYLHIEQTQVTESGVRVLQVQLPKCEIVSDYI